MPLFSVPVDGQPVVITEAAFPFRIVTLAGADRPEQPVTLSSRQRVAQTYYPGSDAASVQFMGTSNDPVVLRGWFKDPISALAGSGAKQQEALLKGLQQSGSNCKLLWGTRIVRQGRIERLDFELYKDTKVRYEITFAVDKSDERVALAPRPSIPGTIAAFAAALRLAVENAGKVVEIVRTAKVLVGIVR